MRGFVVISIAVAAAASGLWSIIPKGAEHHYLIAGEKLDVRALGRLGKIAPARSGFYRITLAGTDQDVLNTLKRSGAEFILAPDADSVDLKSAKSVTRHREYKLALARLHGLDESHERADFWEAIDDELDKRKGPNGDLDWNAVRKAVEHREQMPKAYVSYNEKTNAPQGPWTHLGPFSAAPPFPYCNGTQNVSGRKESIAVAKGDSNTIWTVSRGGAFKTIDGGTHWENMSAGWKFTDANCVAIDPTDKNIVYVGTGDYADGGAYGSLPFGIMKTTDGGQSWTNYGDLTTFDVDETITEILIAPWNRNTLFCTTRHGNRISNSAGNLYRSLDAGATWVDTGLAADAYTDLAASIGFLVSLRTYYYVYACTDGGKVYRTSDGTTWTQTASNAGAGYTHIACGKLSSNTIYAISNSGHIQRSIDKGDTWVDFNSAGFPLTEDGGSNWAQLTYNAFVGVTKIDASTEKIYVGTLTCATRTNTSTTWTDLSKSYTNTARAHADHHSFANDPNNNNVVYIGTDGGIYKNLANSTSMSALNNSFGDFQCYALDVHPNLPDFVMVGNQDNACQASRGNLNSWTGLDAWDGGFVAFDKVNPKNQYTSSQKGFAYKYTADFQPNDANVDLFPTDSQRTGYAFICPMATVGTGAEILMGTGRILRYPGTGTTWISGFSTGSTIDEIATLSSVVVFGCRNGAVYRSIDKGTNAVNISQNLPDVSIGAVYLKGSTDVLVGLMGSTGGLYRSTDAGNAIPTWTNVSGSGPTGLPASPVNSIAVDPYNSLRYYVGTDAGLFMSSNGGTTWASCSTQGFPNVCVTGLKTIHNYLYASTAGLGVWRIKLGSTIGHSISGIAYETGVPLPGVKVRLTTSGDIEGRLSNSVSQAIPDNDADGIQSNTYNFFENHTMVTCKVFVHINHTYRGDLRIDLKGPDGTTIRLKDTLSGDSTDDVVATYDVTSTFGGTSSLGLWQLQVRDLAAADIGTLNTWSVIYTYAGSKTIAETLTDSEGKYSFSALLADTYTVTPNKASKVFVPSSRTAILDGSNDVTGANFNSLVPIFLGVSPIDLIGGYSATGTLKLSVTPETLAYVQISSNSSAVSPPSNVGMNTAGPTSFGIQTAEVKSPVTTTLSATYGGVTQKATLKLYPIPTLLSITAGPTPIYGGRQVLGHVNLTAIAPADTVVYLSGFAPDIVPTTSSVTILKGKQSAAFYANTTVVDTPRTRQLWAMLGTQSLSTDIAIEPPPKIIGWSFNPSDLRGGDPTVGTITLERPVIMAPLRIFLGDNSGSFTMPSYIDIPVGASEGTVNATTGPVTQSIRVQCQAWFKDKVGLQTTYVTLNP